MWEYKRNHLIQTFEFNNFVKAVEFINTIALLKIVIQHIPFWEENRHLVTISIKTKNADGAISLDEKKLIEKIENIFSHI
ncbi:MAG TPA: 4a-hydroxytetrahydrobiopterin dehydratase [Bacteroidales bacterium]|nr:4a-hydroxytetrahydrobiopterin dehydratase [Bacteroidales bacterium]